MSNKYVLMVNETLALMETVRQVLGQPVYQSLINVLRQIEDNAWLLEHGNDIIAADSVRIRELEDTVHVLRERQLKSDHLLETYRQYSRRLEAVVTPELLEERAGII